MEGRGGEEGEGGEVFSDEGEEEGRERTGYEVGGREGGEGKSGGGREGPLNNSLTSSSSPFPA